MWKTAIGGLFWAIFVTHATATWAQTLPDVEPVEINGLQGSYQAPSGTGAGQRLPAALIIAGSGPTDRDGNSPLGLRTDAYKQLAAALAQAGIASLRFDKRGVASSAKALNSESDATIEMFAADVTAMARWLATRNAPAGVVLIGHSEGGILALLAAGEVQPPGIVLLTTPGRPFVEVLREQLARQEKPPALAAEIDAHLLALEQGRPMDEPSPELRFLFRRSVQPFLQSVARLDPAVLAKALSVPLLVVGGDKDVQVTRIDFDKFEALAWRSARLWIPGMTHTLKAFDNADPKQVAAYTDPTSPVMPELTAAVISFIRGLGN